MTEQEKRIQEQTKDAIEVLGFLKTDFENKAKPRCKFARVRAGLFFAIKALEKQIPKKPIIQSRGVYDDDSGDWLRDEEWNMCPTCTTRNEVYRGWSHCIHCGQKLDWE